MSEVSAVKTAGSRTASPAQWYERLTVCLPLVFFIGAPTVFITRAIFLKYYPDHFVNDSPTISETASHAPSSQFFEVMMLAVMLCIVVSWSLNLMRNSRRLSGLASTGTHVLGPNVLSWTSCFTGIFAGFFLAVVSIFNLNDGHDMHMFGSWAFYISQVLSITFDIFFVLWMRRLVIGPAMKDALWGRVAVAAGIFAGSLFFLYMYETKDYATPAHKYAIQVLYISTEYVVCMLCLFYPITAYAEMRRHFREFAVADRSR